MTEEFKSFLNTHAQRVRESRQNAAGGVVAAAVTILIGLLSRIDVEVTPDEAAALVTIIYFAVAHFTSPGITKSKEPEPVQPEKPGK